jgi:hypothetical protein
MTQAFVTLTADRIQAGQIRKVDGALQQETRLYQGTDCVCKLLVIFPPGSPEWMKWHARQALDGAPRLATTEHHQV